MGKVKKANNAGQHKTARLQQKAYYRPNDIDYRFVLMNYKHLARIVVAHHPECARRTSDAYVRVWKPQS